jgi:glutamate synthase (NADPH/NADH) large chain
MGNDTPISALSDKPKLLFTCFKQNFAQVTTADRSDPRELVMSLVSIIGPRPNLFDLEGMSTVKRRGATAHPHQRGLGENPLDLEISDSHFKSLMLDATWAADIGAKGLPTPSTPVQPSRTAVRDGINIIICRTAMPAPTASDPVAARLRRRPSPPDPRGCHPSVRTGAGPASPARSITSPVRRLRLQAIQPLSRLRTLIEMKDELPQKLDDKGNRQALHQSIDRDCSR